MGTITPPGASAAGPRREREPIVSSHAVPDSHQVPSEAPPSQPVAPSRRPVTAVTDVPQSVRSNIPRADLPHPPTTNNDTASVAARPTQERLGRRESTITADNRDARSSGTTTNATALNELKEAAQKRVILPGISGIPVRLFDHHDTAEAALRATERVYDMYLDNLGVDPATRQAQAAELTKRSAEIMRHLFSGEQDTNPDGARAAGIQALQTASDLYTQLVDGTIESIPSNGNNNPSTVSEVENPLRSKLEQIAKDTDIAIPPEKLQEAIEKLTASYPPEVASKLSSLFEQLAHLTDQELANSCGDITDLVQDAVGFDYEIGTFLLDRPDPDGLLYSPHVWPVDQQGRRPDFSLRQFNPYLNPENQIDPSTTIIDKNHPAWGRYSPTHDY